MKSRKYGFDLFDIEMSSPGMDDFMSEEFGPNRIRVASLDDLVGFRRVASDTLIRKAEKDLWSLEQTEDGDWVVERMFDDDGNPIKV